jgi:hypothetical protein
VLAGVVCAGLLVLAGLAAGRGLWKPPVRVAEPQKIIVTLSKDVLDPAVMLLLPGAVRFVVRNDSGTPRVFSVTGPGLRAATGVLENGATGTLTVTFSTPGRYVAGSGRNGSGRRSGAAGSIRVRLP